MKTLLFILMVFCFAACNEGPNTDRNACIEAFAEEFDTIHIQSIPEAAIDLHDKGYDTSKVLVILPPGEQ